MSSSRVRSFGSKMVCLLAILFTVVIFPFIDGSALPSSSSAERDESQQSDVTCMTRILQSVSDATSTSHSRHKHQEKLLHALLKEEEKDSVADIDPALLQFVFGTDQTAASDFLECTGTSTEECRHHLPCLNGGRCIFGHPFPSSTEKVFACACSNGHTGTYCETALVRCSDTTCGDGGTCLETADGYLCSCPPLRTGRHCETSWFNPVILWNITASILRLSYQQREMQKEETRNTEKMGGKVHEFLSKFASRMESSLTESLESFHRNERTNVEKRFESIERRLSVLTTPDASQPSTPSTAGLVNTSPTAPPSSATTMVTRPTLRGSELDSAKKSAQIALSNNGRTAIKNDQSGDTAAIGKEGYASEVHEWRVKVSGITAACCIGLGVTTLPLSPLTYDKWSAATAYVWFNSQWAGGVAASQTASTARMSIWQNNDILVLTLDSDQHLLRLHLQRTNETKTIYLKQRDKGKKFYLYVLLKLPGHRVDIL